MANPSEQKGGKSELGLEKGLATDGLREGKVLPGPADTPEVPKGSYELLVLQSLR